VARDPPPDPRYRTFELVRATGADRRAELIAAAPATADAIADALAESAASSGVESA
jgi:hypothetical protein